MRLKEACLSIWFVLAASCVPFGILWLKDSPWPSPWATILGIAALGALFMWLSKIVFSWKGWDRA